MKLVRKVGATSGQLGCELIGDGEPLDRGSVNVKTFVFEVCHVSRIGLAQAWLLESGSGSGSGSGSNS